MKILVLILFLILTYSQTFAVTDTLEWEYMGSPGYGDCQNIGINSKGDIFFCGNSSLERSTDGGETWVTLRFHNSETYQRIQFDSQDNIYFLENPYSNFFLFSSDNGNNWDTVYVPFNQSFDYAGPIKVLNNDLLFTFIQIDKSLYIIFSSNKGKNWQYLPFPSMAQYSVEYYSCHMNKQGDIAVLVNVGDRQSHIFLKMYHDTLWTELVYEIEYITNIHIVSTTEFYISTLQGMFYSNDSGKTLNLISPEGVYSAYFPTDSEIYIGKSSGMSYSPDKGKTWINLDDKFSEYVNPEELISSSILLITGDTNGNIYAAMRFCGVFVSSDKGTNWYNLGKNLNASINYDMTFDKMGNIYTFGRGLQKSTDYGRTWQMLGFKDYRYGQMFCTSKGTILASNKKGIIKSTDNGETWTVTKKGLAEENYPAPRFAKFVENKKGTIFGKVYNADLTARSFDEGETWEKYYDSASGTDIAINSIDELFILSGSGEIYRSKNEAITWEQVAPAYPRPPVYSTNLVMHPNAPTGYAYFEDYNSISTDNGMSWNKVYGERPPLIQRAFVDSTNKFCFFWEDKIQRSDNKFSKWDTLYNKGLKHPSYYVPIVSPDGYYYVFAYNGGVYRSKEKILSVDNYNTSISNQMVISVFPNPANSLVYISIHFPINQRVNYKLFNYIGLPIASLSGKSGETVSFDVSNLPQGVYFIRAETELQSAVKSFVIEK